MRHTRNLTPSYRRALALKTEQKGAKTKVRVRHKMRMRMRTINNPNSAQTRVPSHSGPPNSAVQATPCGATSHNCLTPELLGGRLGGLTGRVDESQDELRKGEKGACLHRDRYSVDSTSITKYRQRRDKTRQDKPQGIVAQDQQDQRSQAQKIACASQTFIRLRLKAPNLRPNTQQHMRQCHSYTLLTPNLTGKDRRRHAGKKATPKHSIREKA